MPPADPFATALAQINRAYALAHAPQSAEAIAADFERRAVESLTPPAPRWSDHMIPQEMIARHSANRLACAAMYRNAAAAALAERVAK